MPAKMPHSSYSQGQAASEKKACCQPVDLLATDQVQTVHQAHAGCAAQYESDPVKWLLRALAMARYEQKSDNHP
jgi:hypothetical protein